MKLCFLLGGNEEGGLENHVLTLCNQLSLNHQVTLIAHPQYRDRLVAEVKCIALPMHWGRRNPLLQLRLWWALRSVKADLIHAHGNKATALLATIRKRVSGKCIATVHSQKKNTAMFECMDGVIGVSAGVLEPIRHPAKRVIYNGVDPYEGAAVIKSRLCDEWEVEHELPLSVAIGRLVPVKAYDQLIRAWEGQAGSLVIIGEGRERRDLQQTIDRLNLSDRVKLVGVRDDVQALLAAVDLLVISSEREGFSLVLVEALLARVPVISTRVAGSREVLPATSLCPCGDERALSTALDTALSDLSLFSEQCEPAFEFARRQLTTDAMLAQTEQYYIEMVTSG